MNEHEACEWIKRVISAVLEVLGPVCDKFLALFAPEPTKPAHRPPTRPRQAQPWELRSQVSDRCPPAWQRCPQRHWARESRDRWQRGVDRPLPRRLMREVDKP